jgi:hypothetical protein
LSYTWSLYHVYKTFAIAVHVNLIFITCLLLLLLLLFIKYFICQNIMCLTVTKLSQPFLVTTLRISIMLYVNECNVSLTIKETIISLLLKDYDRALDHWPVYNFKNAVKRRTYILGTFGLYYELTGEETTYWLSDCL